MLGRRGILKGIFAGAASVTLGSAGANAAAAAPTHTDNGPWDRQKVALTREATKDELNKLSKHAQKAAINAGYARSGLP
jgi:hypothetical protein